MSVINITSYNFGNPLSLYEALIIVENPSTEFELCGMIITGDKLDASGNLSQTLVRLTNLSEGLPEDGSGRTTRSITRLTRVEGKVFIEHEFSNEESHKILSDSRQSYIENWDIGRIAAIQYHTSGGANLKAGMIIHVLSRG